MLSVYNTVISFKFEIQYKNILLK